MEDLPLKDTMASSTLTCFSGEHTIQNLSVKKFINGLTFANLSYSDDLVSKMKEATHL